MKTAYTTAQHQHWKVFIFVTFSAQEPVLQEILQKAEVHDHLEQIWSLP